MTAAGEGITAWLESLPDAQLQHVLDVRTDLLIRPAVSFELLGSRVSQPQSMLDALVLLDVGTAQVAGVVAHLGGRATVAQVEEVLARSGEVPAGHVEAALQRLSALALAWPVEDGMAWRVPSGMRSQAPSLLDRGVTFRSVAERVPLQRLRGVLEILELGVARSSPDAVEQICAVVEDPARVIALLDEAPVSVQEALTTIATDGPVHGLAAEPREWLVARCFAFDAGDGATTVPAELLAAVRGQRVVGRVHLEPERVAPKSSAGADVALALVAEVRALLAACGPGLKHLQSGGIGIQERRRLAKLLRCEPERVTWLLDVCGDAGLLSTGYEAGVPTKRAAAWLAWGEVEGYVALVRPALAAGPRSLGDTDDAALAGYRAPRTQPTFRQVAEAALRPATDESLVAWLKWRWYGVHPGRIVSEMHLVRAFGLHGPWLAPLLEDDVEGAHKALGAVIPPEQDEAVFQADGTVIVAGRASAGLRALLALVADQEAERTWRVTPTGVRRALDAGRTSTELIEELRTRSQRKLPQVIEQLVLDGAAKHGQIEVFAAATLLRVDDEPLAITLLRDKKLASLGLKQVQPGVLASVKKPAEVMAGLRAVGHAPVGPASKAKAAPEGVVAGSTVRPRWLAEPASVVAGLRQGTLAPVFELFPQPTWHTIFAPHLPPYMGELLEAAMDEGGDVEIDYVDSGGSRTTRVISEIAQVDRTLEAWCELRQDERVFLIRNILAVRPA